MNSLRLNSFGVPIFARPEVCTYLSSSFLWQIWKLFLSVRYMAVPSFEKKRSGYIIILFRGDIWKSFDGVNAEGRSAMGLISRIRDKFSRRDTTRHSFVGVFKRFQEIVEINNRLLDLIAKANDKLGGNYIFDQQYIRSTCSEIADLVQKLVNNLDNIAPKKYRALYDSFYRIQGEIDEMLAGRLVPRGTGFVLPYEKISRDLVEVVGSKNANIAEVGRVLGLRIPRGFAITIAAFETFLNYNQFDKQITNLTTEWQEGRSSTQEVSQRIQDMISIGTVPPGLEKALKNALDKMDDVKGFAVRSSALGEDGYRSFAGQYRSLLNVSSEEVPDAYRQVLASTYSERAMEYRRSIGFTEHEVAMAVGCQEMIGARASGVLYTMDPNAPERDTLLISATWGLGVPVVSGEAATDRFVVSRRPPYKVKELDLVHKETEVLSEEGGGTSVHALSGDMEDQVCLGNKDVMQAAETGIIIEKFFKRPQDIEFAINRQGQLVILQTRPLAIKPITSSAVSDLPKITENYPVIFRDKGTIAQEGIASGTAFIVRDEADLDRFPSGAIIVSKFASPILAKALVRAAGLITDVGSSAGHLATIAREYRVPAILGTGNATDLLSEGQEITVDAEENIVYQGIIKELQQYGLRQESIEETYEYRLLRRILRKIEPLNLVDPLDRHFTPEACKTMHDIVRFVHEKAVNEVIDLKYYQRQDQETTSGKLKWDIPLDMVIIDIGGGLSSKPKDKIILPEQIASLPMQSMLEGLARPGAWSNKPMSVDLGSFMSSMTRTFSTELASPRCIGENLAVLSKNYANVSLRLGYHFTMVDAYISENTYDNYAYFRFFGGVTDETRRARRAELIGELLEHFDFRTEIHGDLVVARIKKFSMPIMQKRLYIIGVLIGFSRQLDVCMANSHSVSEYFEKFRRFMEDDYEQSRKDEHIDT
ncbi:MAG: hypothetical protein GWP10_01230 [Nitrospiraceae bacterium]|nr:hypothetical protein [Nitrospiraceae bacterium]